MCPLFCFNMDLFFIYQSFLSFRLSFVVVGCKVVVLLLVATRWHFISAVLWHLWGKSKLSYFIPQVKESQLNSPIIMSKARTDYNFSLIEWSPIHWYTTGIQNIALVRDRHAGHFICSNHTLYFSLSGLNHAA